LYEIDRYFPMKKGSIGDPDIHLRSKLRTVTLCNGVKAWSASPSKYVQEAVRILETYLSIQGKGVQLPKRATAPWPTEYVSELDDTPELGAEMISHYQSLVGILHWMYVDSDHTGDKSNHRLRTGFFIYLNNALIMWTSKKQPTIETLQSS